MKYDIIIIGSGAAGLIALKELTAAGYHVCMLEANSHAGGRMATIKEFGFDEMIETGAEFIHGKLPLTLQLLKEANIPYQPVEGKMITVQKGEWQEEMEDDENWELFLKELKKVKEDMSIQDFLDEHFFDSKYAELRDSIKRFAEGFDLADISRASILSVKNEWSHIDETQYRIPGGYIQLVDYLLEKSREQNAIVHFNSCVSKIEYSKGHAVITTTDGKQFEAAKIIVTVSAGVLQSGDIEFLPALETHPHALAIRKLGFGTVIKIALQFKTAFWKQRSDDTGFLITDEEIPTWWTQLPANTNLLTGWKGGPEAAKRSSETNESLLASALRSLSSIFHLSIDTLREELAHHQIFCWSNYPYIKGGYSYSTTGSDQAKKILAHPIDNTIFFAGEAVYEGESQGTVEAALQSGLEISRKIKRI